MKTTTFITLLTLVSSLVMLQAGGASPPDAVRRDIAAQSQLFTSALERGDAKAATDVFTSAAKLSTPNSGGLLSGHEAISNYWRAAIDGGLKTLELVPADLEGDGNLRIETGSFAAYGADRAEFGRGQYLIVWKREDGAWKIHRDFGHPVAVRAPVATAMTVDRVGFPGDYHAGLSIQGASIADAKSSLTTVFANPLAVSVSPSSRLQYPNGSIILMEFADPQRDGEGQVLHDARGQPLKGAVAHIDVMRRGAGYGEIYGERRAGEWEFASYRPDGTTLVAPGDAAHCAGCHRNAGADKDFVFRKRPWTAAE